MNIFKKVRAAKEKQAKLTEAASQVRQEIKDFRYNEPKGKHKAKEEVIAETIESNDIYSRAKEHILNAQRKQVGYGLDKYPEPLNADTWTTIETIDHIIDEAVDKLHYLVMLRIKLEQQADMRDYETEEEPPTYPLYADGEKYMSYVEPGKSVEQLQAEYDEFCRYGVNKSMSMTAFADSELLANEVKIDSEGRVRGLYNPLLEEVVSPTVHSHSTYMEHVPTTPMPDIQIESWVGTTSCESRNIEVSYTLQGEMKSRKITIDEHALMNIEMDSDGHCGDDLDAIRYAIENAIRNERF